MINLEKHPSDQLPGYGGKWVKKSKKTAEKATYFYRRPVEQRELGKRTSINPTPKKTEKDA